MFLKSFSIPIFKITILLNDFSFRYQITQATVYPQKVKADPEPNEHPQLESTWNIYTIAPY